VLAKTGSPSEIEFLPLPVDDPNRRRPDITLAREVLGWEPRVSLDEGLDTTIAYYRSEVLEPVAQSAGGGR
jgi:nucleoside-diphosphate-sugar epimerase